MIRTAVKPTFVDDFRFVDSCKFSLAALESSAKLFLEKNYRQKKEKKMGKTRRFFLLPKLVLNR